MPDRSRRTWRQFFQYWLSTWLVLVGSTAWMIACPWEFDHYRGTIVSGTPGNWYVSVTHSQAMNITFEIAISRGVGRYHQLTVRNIGTLR